MTLQEIIEDLESRLRFLRDSIATHANSLKVVALEAFEGAQACRDDDGWKSTIQVTPLAGSNQMELMMEIAEFNARLLTLKALQQIQQ